MRLPEIISLDMAAYPGSSKSLFHTLISPGFEFLFYFRLVTLFSKWTILGALGRIRYHSLMHKYGYQIPANTKIGPGLRISHFGSLVINNKTVIGSNCYFSHNITIGETKRGNRIGVPILGDRVWIGPGAVIVGNIKIGNDVLIAPLSYVTDDVPDNAVVAGNPAKIISMNGSAGYISHISRS